MSTALGSSLIGSIVVLSLLIAFVWYLMVKVHRINVEKKKYNPDHLRAYEELREQIADMERLDAIAVQRKSAQASENVNALAKRTNVKVLLTSSEAAKVLNRVKDIETSVMSLDEHVHNLGEQNDQIFATINPAIVQLNQLDVEVNDYKTFGRKSSEKSAEIDAVELRYNALKSDSEKERLALYSTASNLNDTLKQSLTTSSYHQRMRNVLDRSAFNDEDKIVNSVDTWMGTNQGYIGRFFIREMRDDIDYPGTAFDGTHDAIIYPSAKINEEKPARVSVSENLVRLAIPIETGQRHSILLARKTIGPWTYVDTILNDSLKECSTLLYKSDRFRMSITLANATGFESTWKSKVLSRSDTQYHLLLLVNQLEHFDEMYNAIGEKASYLTAVDESFAYAAKPNVAILTNLVLERLLSTNMQHQESILVLKMPEYKMLN